MSVATFSTRELAIFVGLLVKTNQKSFNAALEIACQASNDNCLAFEATYPGDSAHAVDYDDLEREALNVLANPEQLLESFGPLAYNMVANDGSSFGDVTAVRNMEAICKQYQEHHRQRAAAIEAAPAIQPESTPSDVPTSPVTLPAFVRPDHIQRREEIRQERRGNAPTRERVNVEAVRETIAQTIENAFPFSVDLKSLYGPDGQRTPHCGLFRSDNGQNVGNAFKSGYTPHQTSDVVALAEAASDAFGTDCEIETAWNDGHFVTIAPTREYRRQIFQPRSNDDGGDNVFPRLIVKAGYNGRAFTGTLGIYRDVCSNLQILRQVGGHSASIKHTTGLRGRMDDLRSTFLQVAAQWSHAADLLQLLEAKPVNLAEFLANVYPMDDGANKATRTTHEKRVAAIVNRVIRERRDAGRPSFGTDYDVSAFEAFQAVNGYEIWDKPRRGRPSPMDRVIKSFDSKPSQRAEKLAFELAAV